MSLTMLRHNVMVLEDLLINYEKLKNNKDLFKLEILKKQILYLLKSINKLAKEEKNAR